MNPFEMKAKKVEDYIVSFKDMYPTPYDKNAVDPYTKTRIILAAGAEYEANWHSHHMTRHISDPDLRRELALCRFVEKQQQQKIANLKPLDEDVLETTIAYEQLAVDLTAEMAQKEKNFYVKKALDFALLEDFDHLYRYANLLDMDYGIHAERLVGKYTEIMPARPTVNHHRHPFDNVKDTTTADLSETQTVLNTLIITAAEQQTMNYYMNNAAAYKNDRGRKLYQEISLVEEEHVTQYGCLIDSSPTYLESCLWHEYSECFIYWSNYMTETDKKIKALWERYFELEISHLLKATELLKKYEGKEYLQIIKNPEFPSPLSLHENIEYVRDVLAETAQFTGLLTDYTSVDNLEPDHRFFKHNALLTTPIKDCTSHKVIIDRTLEFGEDYRFETRENPIEKHRDREQDDVTVGQKPNATKTGNFHPIEQ